MTWCIRPVTALVKNGATFEFTPTHEPTSTHARSLPRDHGPESDHIHPPSTPDGPNTSTARHGGDFVSEHVQTALQNWKETIPIAHPIRDELLGYIEAYASASSITLCQQVPSKVPNLKR